MRTFLTDFRHLRPRYQSSQAHSLEWIAHAHAICELAMSNEPESPSARGERLETELTRMRRFVSRYGCSEKKISGRGHELEDFTHLDWDRMRLFNFTKAPSGPDADARSACYGDLADGILSRFYEEEKTPPAHLIHVTCTGYLAPSAAQKLVARKGWHQDTTVTHAYHMGCAAAMPAIRMANGFLRADSELPGVAADILHTEICSLHVEPGLHTPEQLIVQSLFSDGHIRYRMIGGRELEARPRAAYELLMQHEEIVPETEPAMTWRTGPHGMRMTLNASVPGVIAENLNGFLSRLFAHAKLDLGKELPGAFFAIHPGGPRIIEQVARGLTLRDEQYAASSGVFYDYGNMSSSTLPHVWERMLLDKSIPDGALVVSLAFAPGLTVSGNILRKVTG